MRKEALLIGLFVGMGFLNGAHADEGTPACVACQGVAQETPNQRRLRLGQPIQASFPAPDYGEKLETPNQRRKRLGLPMATAAPAVSGVAEETPNHKRQRLAAEAALTESRS